MKKSLKIATYSVLALTAFLTFGINKAEAKVITEQEMPERGYLIGTYLFHANEYDPTLADIMLAAKTIAGNTLDDMKVYTYHYNTETNSHLWREVSTTTDKVVNAPAVITIDHVIMVDENNDRNDVSVPSSSAIQTALQNQKDAVSALTEGDYTVSTWADVTTALALTEKTDTEKETKTQAIKEAIATLVKKVDAMALETAGITSLTGGTEYNHNTKSLTISKQGNTILIKENDALKSFLNHTGGTVAPWFGLLVDLGITRENLVATGDYKFDGGELEAAVSFGATNANQFILWLTPDMNGKTFTFADKTNPKNNVSITIEVEAFTALSFNGNFETDRVSNDVNNDLYQVMKIAYDRKVELDHGTILTVKKDNQVIWKEQSSKTSVNASAWFTWSFRDVSSILSTLKDNIITDSASQLGDLERANTTLLKAGDVLNIAVTGIYQGKEYTIAKEYTVTEKDIKDATYIKDETSVLSFNGSFETDRVSNDTENDLYQVMKVAYDRKLDLDHGTVLTIKKGGQVIWKEQSSKANANQNAWFTWSFRDVSSVLNTLDGSIITDSASQLGNLERDNATLLKADDVLSIAVTGVFNGTEYTITQEYTVTEKDIIDATYKITA